MVMSRMHLVKTYSKSGNVIHKQVKFIPRSPMRYLCDICCCELLTYDMKLQLKAILELELHKLDRKRFKVYADWMRILQLRRSIRFLKYIIKSAV